MTDSIRITSTTDDLSMSHKPISHSSSSSTQRHQPLLIAVSGGSSSGKKAVCEMIIKRMGKAKSLAKVLVIKMEDFYRELDADLAALADKGKYNFDHPDAMDFELLEKTIRKIVNHEPVDIPQYDFIHHRRLGTLTRIQDPDVVLIAGIHMLYSPKIRDLMDLKIFVDVDSDTRLSRQVIRDTESRYQKSVEKILEAYMTHVKPAFEDYIFPTKKFADIILPRGEANTVAINLIAEHILDTLVHGRNAEMIKAIMPARTELYTRVLREREFHPVQA